MKTYRQPSRLPLLPSLEGLPPQVADYQRRLAVALEEWYRASSRTAAEIDAPSLLKVALTTHQTLTANTLTTVQFDSVIEDTRNGWNAATFTYTPTEPGFYRASWAIDLVDIGAPIATSTYGFTQLNDHFVFAYGNGAQQDLNTVGSAIVECDGTTAISLQAFMLAGANIKVRGEVNPYRSWLDIHYLGRRPL